MSCRGHEDELWLYAADALDEPGRRESIEAHLAAGCPRCHAQIAEARQCLGQLPLALDPAPPSPAARQRLLARIRQSHAAGRRIGPWVAATAAAAAIVLVGLALIWPAQQQRRELAEFQSFIDSVLDVFSAEEPTDELIERMKTGAAVLSTLGSPDHELISFHGSPDHEHARAHLIWDAEHEEAYLFVTDLDPPGENEWSRLWLHTQDDRHVPVKTVTWDERGVARLHLRWPVRIDELAGASISYDEQEDAAEPTRPVLLARMQ